MHHRQGQREAARQIHRRPHRHSDGRLAALSAHSESNQNAEALTDTIEADTIGHGYSPVTQPAASENPPLDLPPIEDTASIQLALIDVLQALAANQLDPKRAGLLLYGLQVASANAKNVQVDANSIRSISYTKEGIPLATQEHGWDVEDIEEADRLAEEEED